MGPSLLSSIVGVERVCSGRKAMATLHFQDSFDWYSHTPKRVSSKSTAT
jgi:hypothetical protein